MRPIVGCGLVTLAARTQFALHWTASTTARIGLYHAYPPECPPDGSVEEERFPPGKIGTDGWLGGAGCRWSIVGCG